MKKKVHDLDYTNHVSPNPEHPDQGLMAVEAVKMLAPYIKNFTLDTPNTLMFPSLVPIPVPPLQTYTFIAVIGKVIARTIHPNPSELSQQSQSASSKSQKSQQSASTGPGSAAGKIEPATPTVQGEIKAGEEGDDTDAEEEVEAEAEENEEGEEENELAALEALQAQNAPTPKPKGRKRKGGDTPTPKTKAAKK